LGTWVVYLVQRLGYELDGPGVGVRIDFRQGQEIFLFYINQDRLSGPSSTLYDEYWDCFRGGKEGRGLKLTANLHHLVRKVRMVELCLQSPIRFHGMMLNKSPGITLCLLYRYLFVRSSDENFIWTCHIYAQTYPCLARIITLSSSIYCRFTQLSLYIIKHNAMKVNGGVEV
jgi:hypothetical protein